MKAFTSIFRLGRRRRVDHRSPRKRPARSFASTFALLEDRAMLSVVGPVIMTPSTLSATTAALIESAAIPPVPPGLGQGGFATPHGGGGQQQGSTGQGNYATSGGGQQGSTGSNGGQQGSTGSNGGQHVGLPSKLVDPVAMDVARISVNGESTPELALADFDSSEVYVRLGNGGSTVELGPTQGVDHPDSLALADINGDGIPDLIVANTNGNNVLIFPGLGNGQFGPEENGGEGVAVGNDPIGITVNYVDGDPDEAQLIVANAESDSVTVLDGRAAAGAWMVTSTSTIATQSLPVKTLLYDINADGDPDLVVCNSGSDDVTVYSGLGDGSFATTAIATVAVGLDPEAMVIGQFVRRSETDLVTVNAGSNDLTVIEGLFGANPTTQTISSGGTSPDAAFAFDPGHTGVMDLVVANGGDGRVAIFRGGNEGLQLAGVITQANVPAPTALAPGSSGSNELEFFAASAGEDAALLLSFDLAVASTFLPGSSSDSAAIGQGDDELFGQLLSFEDASMALIAVFWAGSPESEAVNDTSNLREPSTITALYSPTEGQGDEEPDRMPRSSNEPATPPAGAADPSKVDESRLYEFVSGLGAALDRPAGYTEAIAARDVPEVGDDRSTAGLARLDPARPGGDHLFDPDVEPASGLLDGVIRLQRSEGAAREGLEPVDWPPNLEPVPMFDGVDAPSAEGRIETVPLISTVLLASTRLILNASPPRPPGSRWKSWLRRFVSLEHDRKAGDRPDAV